MNREITSVDLSNENNDLPTIGAAQFLQENSWEILQESIEILAKSLKLGRVRGLVSIIDFPSADSEHQSNYIQLIQELMNRDIIVSIFSSETVHINNADFMESDFFHCAGDGLAEFCDFVSIQPLLHVENAINAYEVKAFHENMAKAVAVNITDLPVAVVASNWQQLQDECNGAFFALGDSPEKTADIIDAHIHDKREAVQWCDRCGGRFSPFS